MTQYEAVIGLEVHVQLKTQSKLFTRAPYRYGVEPNTLVDEVVLGLPGSLPVLNKAAVLKTVQVGLVFDCEIARQCKWDRKNYFYPDSPKNYQISQFDQPLCLGGHVEIELEGPARNIQGKHRKVALNRIHLEEDVGKLTHLGQISWIDYNRAGTPLIEIVSEPDMHSPEEVFAYLKSLVMHLQYVDASDCDMEKGQLRCDANISVRPQGTTSLGTKVELKNLNSISGVCNGVRHEINRQLYAIERGQAVVQETRRWDADKSESFVMRSKEDAHDYRYFTDPDLCPICLSEADIQAQKKTLPEFPFDKQERYLRTLQLPYTVTSVICPDKRLSDFFESALGFYAKNPLGIANWIVNDLLRELAAEDMHQAWKNLKMDPRQVAALVELVDSGILSKQSAKEVFDATFKTGEDPQKIVKDKGLEISVDVDALKIMCAEIIDAFPKPAEEFRSGKEKALNVLKGQVVKHTQGKVPISEVDRLLRELLSQ
ncbi:MAG: Asp-tRNA(Asn)/Glu-tRNA(Gln) amidotransferase subunit GatB [Puniceicoccales bacterium]|jgi:aspartyl-tRNA(Asn)/glutamyl-tRNA(Gln) amidotransferase subunit B|nr:Asp-tRNA(Asn)/Glu-tRNA(Gln) amidotransferase subunit GatB [Puniceicoccales bacterium]